MNLTTMTRPLFIPVVLGTVRKGRACETVAKFVFGEVQKREGVETELIDIRDSNLPIDDAGEQIKDGNSRQSPIALIRRGHENVSI